MKRASPDSENASASKAARGNAQCDVAQRRPLGASNRFGFSRPKPAKQALQPPPSPAKTRAQRVVAARKAAAAQSRGGSAGARTRSRAARGGAGSARPPTAPAAAGSGSGRPRTILALPKPTSDADEVLTLANELFSDFDTYEGVLAQVPRGSQFQYKARIEQLTGILKGTRSALRSLLANVPQFVDSCAAIERRLRGSGQADEARFEALTSSEAALRAQVQRLEAALTDQQRVAEQSLASKLQLLSESESQLSKREQLLEAKASTESARVDLERRLAEAERQRDELSAQLEAAQARVAESDAREAEWSEALDASDARVKELEAGNSGAAAELKAEVAALREKLDAKDRDLSMAMQNLGVAHTAHETRANELAADKERLEERVTALMESQRQDDGTRFQLRADLAASQRELSSATEAAQKAEEYQHAAQQACEEARAEAQQASAGLQVKTELLGQVEAQLANAQRELIAVSAQMLAVRTAGESEAAKRDAAFERERVELQGRCSELTRERDALREQVHELQERRTALETEVKTLHEAAGENRDQLARLSAVSGEADVLRRRLLEAEDTLGQLRDGSSSTIAELEAKVAEGEMLRRKMHNTIQELRGNVRVFVRTRPFLPSDGVEAESARAAVAAPDATHVRLGEGESAHDFEFDRVFGPTASQEEVFTEVQEFVQSALDGYNVCLFSYGQTGSGKTHTMQGSGTGIMRGIIARAMEKITATADELRAQGWEYTLTASMLEIYNERVRDLLVQPGGPAPASEPSIGHDRAGRTVVNGATDVQITDIEQIGELMEIAARNRAVAATDMNTVSSRSHVVFSVRIQARCEAKGQALRGSLHLVDLAGSERLDRSGAEGQRLKETQAINTSLSALSTVFTSISTGASHVPYRNSKLTYLLADSLGGNSKTLMFVNVSPTDASQHESLCSLRFARQVNQCELGKPKKQVRPTGSASGSGSGSAKVRRVGRARDKAGTV